MPKDSNDDANIDEILAELKNETSEESNTPKEKKTPKNDEFNEYDFTNDTETATENW